MRSGPRPCVPPSCCAGRTGSDGSRRGYLADLIAVDGDPLAGCPPAGGRAVRDGRRYGPARALSAAHGILRWASCRSGAPPFVQRAGDRDVRSAREDRQMPEYPVVSPWLRREQLWDPRGHGPRLPRRGRAQQGDAVGRGLGVRRRARTRPTPPRVVRRQGRRACCTTDGPFAETKEQLGGFWIIKVADLDAALSWAARAPSPARAPVEVRPFQDEPAS